MKRRAIYWALGYASCGVYLGSINIYVYYVLYWLIGSLVSCPVTSLLFLLVSSYLLCRMLYVYQLGGPCWASCCVIEDCHLSQGYISVLRVSVLFSGYDAFHFLFYVEMLVYPHEPPWRGVLIVHRKWGWVLFSLGAFLKWCVRTIWRILGFLLFRVWCSPWC